MRMRLCGTFAKVVNSNSLKQSVLESLLILKITMEVEELVSQLPVSHIWPVSETEYLSSVSYWSEDWKTQRLILHMAK